MRSYPVAVETRIYSFQLERGAERPALLLVSPTRHPYKAERGCAGHERIMVLQTTHVRDAIDDMMPEVAATKSTVHEQGGGDPLPAIVYAISPNRVATYFTFRTWPWGIRRQFTRLVSDAQLPSVSMLATPLRNAFYRTAEACPRRLALDHPARFA